MMAAEQVESSTQEGGAIAAVVGGGLLAMAPFFPWLSVGDSAANGLQTIGIEAMLLMVMGMAGAALPIQFLLSKKIFHRWGALLMGVLASLLSIFYLSQLNGFMKAVPGDAHPQARIDVITIRHVDR